MSNISLTELM